MSDGLSAKVDVRLGALHLDVALAVGRGETLAIVGPNGAGKTTLLRALAGLHPIDGGEIGLAGRVLDNATQAGFVPPEDRSIGVVFQDYVLFPHLSALDNVAFGLRSQRIGGSEADRRARSWLERVGLGDHAGAKPHQLSGGQAQRVALARALATEPAMLLLDEPLAALDATTRAVTRHDLRRHLEAHDGVRIVVTHDILDASALGSRMVVLEDGACVQEGTVEELATRPRSRYVADFVGVNLLGGRASGTRVAVGELQLTVAEPSDGEVLLTITPKAVGLFRTRPEGTARNVWLGAVDHVEGIGDRVRVRVRGPVTIVAEVTSAAAGDLSLRDGTDVWVAVKATEINVAPA